MKKAIFLDRDGVLNQTIWRSGKPRAPYTLNEFSLFPGVKEATLLLKELDYLLVVVTNQPDVARGWVTREAVDAVNQKIFELLPIDSLKACFHTEKDDCSCRKPRPGMLVEATREWGINPALSFMIGDRDSDIEAGKNAGCSTILIGKSNAVFRVLPDYECDSLIEAAGLIQRLNN